MNTDENKRIKRLPIKPGRQNYFHEPRGLLTVLIRGPTRILPAVFDFAAKIS
jgi:hypothetical protein